MKYFLFLILVCFNLASMPLETLLCALKQSENILDIRHLDKYDNASTLRAIGTLTEDGNKKFVRNHEFFLEKKSLGESVGSQNGGLYRTSGSNGTFIVKKLDPDATKIEHLREFRNAKLLERMGVGPKCWPVSIPRKGERYLVMEEVKGINIKDIIYRSPDELKTRDEINAMLRINAKTYEEATQAFADRFFANEQLMDELDWLEDILTANDFHTTPDFQFMVDLNNSDRPFTIIDSAKFKIGPESNAAKYDQPGRQIDTIIDQLDAL